MVPGAAEGRLIATELPRYHDRVAAAYFRKMFIFEEDPSSLRNLVLHAAYEDGLVVYLNGEEIFRDAIRTGMLNPNSLAEPGEAVLYRRIKLEKHVNKLKKGVNVMAVEVHRSHPKAPNLLFDASLSYEK